MKTAIIHVIFSISLLICSMLLNFQLMLDPVGNWIHLAAIASAGVTMFYVLRSISNLRCQERLLLKKKIQATRIVL